MPAGADPPDEAMDDLLLEALGGGVLCVWGGWGAVTVGDGRGWHPHLAAMASKGPLKCAAARERRGREALWQAADIPWRMACTLRPASID